MASTRRVDTLRVDLHYLTLRCSSDVDNKFSHQYWVLGSWVLLPKQFEYIGQYIGQYIEIKRRVGLGSPSGERC